MSYWNFFVKIFSRWKIKPFSLTLFLASRKKGPRRSKKGNLKIDETQIIQPEEIPEGSRFKGYQDRVIQDITFQTHNICYRLAEYTTSEGLTIVGQLPDGIQGGSFGKSLMALFSINTITSMSHSHCCWNKFVI